MSNSEREYEAISFHTWEITQFQRERAGMMISGAFFIISALIIYALKVESLYYLFCGLMTYLLYFKLKSWHSDVIDEYEKTQANVFQMAIMQISIGLILADHHQDPIHFILRFLRNFPNLVVNPQLVCKYGETIDETVKSMLFYSPIFNRFYSTMLRHSFDTNVLGQYLEFKKDYEEEFLVFAKNLEMRLNLLFFIAVFYAIAFLSLIPMLLFNYIQLAIGVLIFYCLLQKLVKGAVNRTQLMGALASQTGDEKAQFHAFLQMFQQLLLEFSVGRGQERAILNAFRSLSLKEQEMLQISVRYSDFLTLDNILTTFFQNIKNPAIQAFYPFFRDILSRAPHSSYFSQTLKVIQTHIQAGNDEEITLKAAKVKTNIFKLVLPAMLAIIVNFVSATIQFQTFGTSTPSAISPFYLAFTAFLFNLVVINAFNHLYLQKFQSLDYIAIVIFIVVFIITNSFFISVL